MSTSRLLNPTLAVVVAVLLAAGLLALAINRETPVGSLKGTVVAEESGNPIDVRVSIRLANASDENRSYFHTEAVDGRFSFKRVPVGDYILEVQSTWRHSPPIRVSIAEGALSDLGAEGGAGVRVRACRIRRVFADGAVVPAGRAR